MKAATKIKKFVPDIQFWIGGNVHQKRLAAGLTQAKLAKAAGISVRTLTSVETCAPETNITVQTLVALARALNTSPNELLKAGKGFVEV